MISLRLGGLSGRGLRELVRQRERHLLLVLGRRQSLLRKLLQLGVVIPTDHVVRGLVGKGVAVQRLELLAYPIVL